jgi:hypothetical protein
MPRPPFEPLRRRSGTGGERRPSARAALLVVGAALVGAIGWAVAVVPTADEQILHQVQLAYARSVNTSDPVQAAAIRTEAHNACRWLAAQPPVTQLRPGQGFSGEPGSPQAMAALYLRQSPAAVSQPQVRSLVVDQAWWLLCHDDRATRTRHFVEPPVGTE